MNEETHTQKKLSHSNAFESDNTHDMRMKTFEFRFLCVCVVFDFHTVEMLTSFEKTKKNWKTGKLEK